MMTMLTDQSATFDSQAGVSILGRRRLMYVGVCPNGTSDCLQTKYTRTLHLYI